MKFRVGNEIIRNNTCPKLMYTQLKSDTIYTIGQIREVGENTYVYQLKEIRGNFCVFTFSQKNIDEYFDLVDNRHRRSLKIKKLKEKVDENSKTKGTDSKRIEFRTT